MGTLDGLIELLEVAHYADIFPVALYHGKGLTGPLTRLLPTLLQYACIKAVFDFPSVGFSEMKGGVIGAAAVRGGDFTILF